jgi:hypothetical protein
MADYKNLSAVGVSDDDWGYYSPSFWVPEQKPLTKKCTCGTNITMGYEAPLEFHSSYCDLKEDNDNSKTS